MKKILVRLLVVAAILYLLANVWLYRSQRSLMYFPQPLTASPRAGTFEIESGGLKLRGWVINPGHQQALLYFGGNGESVERDETFFRETLPGISVYLLPYRGYGGNPGSPTEAGLFADGLRAYDYIAARHAVVHVMGRSLGSGVAAEVAVKRKVSRIILATPYDSIEKLAEENYPAFPIRWLLKDKFESWRRVPSIHARTLILIAADDQVVPRAHTDFLISKFPVHPDVVVIDQSGHNSISGKPEYAAAISGFLAKSTLAEGAGPKP